MAQGVKAHGVPRKRWGTAGGTRVTSVNTRNVPIDVRAQFKAYCARRGYSMEAAVIALMRKCIYEDITLPGARPKERSSYTDTGSIVGQANP